MSEQRPSIVVLQRRVSPELLRLLARAWFGDMVKYVVDVERELIALGGEMHADAEAVLLASGSRQEDLWGANYFPGLGPDECVELTSLINIRPSQGNRSMEVADPALQERIRALTFRLIGEGDET